MFDLIYNPIAGKGKAVKALSVVTAKLEEKGIPFRVHETTAKGDGTAITKRLIQEGATDIVSMGGDGTLHEIINGFDRFDSVNLGVIPCGTGNDFGASLGISEDPALAVEHLISGVPTYTDFFEMPFCRGMNIVGAGIDVDVLHRYNAKKNKTKGTYLRSLISAILHHKGYNFHVTVGGEAFDLTCFIVAAGNGKQFGGGIPICPKAVVNDGLFDVVMVSNMPKLSIPNAFIHLLKGKILDFKKTTFRRSDSLTVTSDKPIVLQIDGEIYENVEFSAKLVHDTLKIYRLPAENTASATEKE